MKPNFTSVNDLGLGTAPFFANPLHASLDASSLTVLRNRLVSEKFFPAKISIKQLYTPLADGEHLGGTGGNLIEFPPLAGAWWRVPLQVSLQDHPAGLAAAVTVSSQSLPLASAANHRLHQQSTNRIRLQVGINISPRDNQSL